MASIPTTGIFYPFAGLTIVYHVEVKTPSLANSRMHWAKRARIVKTQRQLAKAETEEALIGSYDCSAHWPIFTAATITLTRYAPGVPLDTDNLASSQKAIRDGIADGCRVNDGDKRITWRYDQVRCKRGQEATFVIIQAET